jgi:hypothetical protein
MSANLCVIFYFCGFFMWNPTRPGLRRAANSLSRTRDVIVFAPGFAVAAERDKVLLIVRRFLQRSLKPADGVANLVEGFCLTLITQSIQRPAEIVDPLFGFFRAH